MVHLDLRQSCVVLFLKLLSPRNKLEILHEPTNALSSHLFFPFSHSVPFPVSCVLQTFIMSLLQLLFLFSSGSFSWQMLSTSCWANAQCLVQRRRQLFFQLVGRLANKITAETRERGCPTMWNNWCRSLSYTSPSFSVKMFILWSELSNICVHIEQVAS